MLHIDEFTLMMYTDNELDAEEREQIELHLSLCSHCNEIYSQLLADQALLYQTFADTAEPHPDIQLNPLTQVQIEAIAALHKQEHARRSRSYTGWFFTGVAALVASYLFINTYVSEWLSTTVSTWQYNFLWTSAFWLKQNMGDFLTDPASIMLEISLFFFLLVGALFFLNYRRSSLQQWNRSEGGVKK